MRHKEKIVVLGVGNLLLSDEGVGIHFLEELKKESLPENVELVDGSVSGFDLLPIIENCNKLIIVDAIKTKDIPGTIYKFDYSQVTPREGIDISLHDVDIFQVLELAKRLKKLPPASIFAVVPEKIDWGMNLTATLRDKIPLLKQLVLKELSA